MILAGLALAAACANAQVMGDAAFFRDLGVIKEGVLADVKGSLMTRRQAGEMTKDDALQIVLGKLRGSVPEAYVRAAFDDPAVKIYPDIPPRFKPGGHAEETTYDKYRKYFMTEDRIAAGAEFYRTHKQLLDQVEQRYGVDPGILAGLLGVETFYGTKTGTYMVFSALYTITLKVPARSDWAANELAEWLKLCYRQRIAPHSVKGSYAGAFGFFQFMPSSFNRFAVDFDGDGTIRFDQWPDVLGSVANYLALAGWQKGGDLEKPAKNYYAIYAYNHSDNYVRVIVELRGEILKRLNPASPSA